MSDELNFESAGKPLGDKPFSAMTSGEKTRFVVKALIFFVTGGFIYPTLWID